VAGDFPANGRRGKSRSEIQNRVAADVCKAELSRTGKFSGQDCFAQAFFQITNGQRASLEKFPGINASSPSATSSTSVSWAAFASLGKNCGDFFYFSFAIAVRRVGEGFH